MIRTTITLAALALTPAATAAPDTDYPHRDWGQVATLDMSLSDSAACLTRELARQYGHTLPIQVDGGTDIDAGPGPNMFGVPYEPWLRFKIRNEASATTLRVFYRHPVSQKQVSKLVQKMSKRCLKVRSISPAN